MKADLTEPMADYYREWVHMNGLPQLSADELIRTRISSVQREWLLAYIHMWDLKQVLENLS